MSQKRYKDIYYSIETDAPTFDADTVRVTLGQYLEKMRDYYAESIVELFRDMSTDFVCNDGFKVGKTFRLGVGGLGCSPWGNHSFGTSIDAHSCPLHYLDVQLHKIAGDDDAPTLQSSNFNNAVLGDTVETKYFKAVTYLRGTAKVTFNDAGLKLLPALNAQIAHYYGSTLPATN